MKTSLVVVMLLFFQGLFGLSVELSVKECAGVGSQGYPIRTVVPIPSGQYQNINSFRLTDAGGTTVPAQFEVLSRHYLGDQSITNVAVTYMPTVSAFTGTGTGITKYYFKDDGTGNSTGTGLVVTEASDAITVVTGPSLKFTVKKTGFNIIDQLWYDPNGGSNFTSGNLVIKSNVKGGGEFIGRLGTQYDADRTDLKVEVEQAGPIEAVIRVEAVTKYYGTTDHTHGWAVRIYAYAGKPFIKIDYQLQNSPKTKQYGWPLYFHAMNLNLDLNLTGTLNVKAGLGNGTVYSGALGTGVALAQRKDSLFKIYSVDGVEDTATALATGGRPDGFLDIDNGTIGVTVQTRNFWQMWPNGIKVDAAQKLSVQLFPKWAAQVNAATSNPVFNTTHLYWLADMQHVFKEVVLNFHAASTTSELINFAKTVNFHPVASIPVAYVGQAGSSLDLAGLIPYSTKLAGADTRLPPAVGSGSLGWYYYVLNGRREGTAAGGGIPGGGGQFWATENPSDWYKAEREAIGEINIRPQWIAQYNYKTDSPLLKLGTNMDGGTGQRFDPYTWRAEILGQDKMDTAILAGTGGGPSIFCIGYATCIDDAHYWHHHIKDYYWITGNRWQQDYYKFIVEYRKNWAAKFQSMTRSGGHPLADAIQALNATGDTVMVRLLHENMLNNRAMIRPQFGDYSALCCGSFGAAGWQLGFGARPLIDYLHQVKDNNPQAWAEAFQILSAYMSWNMNWGNFSYYNWAPERGNSYYGSFSLLDPQAWYYWHTGRKAVLDHAMLYINQGIKVPNGTGDGTKPMTADGGSAWSGDYAGRWMQYVRQNGKTDSIAPAAISNLALTRSGAQATLTWTVPADAKRYHIVWGDKPLVADATDNTRYLNWWAAKTIGKIVTAAAGSQDQATFTVPASGLVFAAVFTWDSSYNLSQMSNVAGSDATPATAPGSFTAVVASAQKVTLSWTASSDAESGVWYYNIYRNGALIATVDGLSYVDNHLVESTGYDYAVAAVSGSNLEGQKAELHTATPVDVIAPAPASITSVGTQPTITILFAEDVDSVSAQTAANYTINRGGSVLSAVLQPDRRTVILTCDALTPDSSYTLTINGVKDLAVTPNTSVNVTGSFTHVGPLSITNTTPAHYIWDVFTPAIDCWIDQSGKMSSIPAQYLGLPLLRTGSMQTKDYNTPVVFTSNKALMVYVMMDPGQVIPTWLRTNFRANGDTVSGIVVWEKEYPAGRDSIPKLIGFNEACCANYFVVVRPLDSSWVGIEDSTDAAGEYADNLSTFPNPFNPQVSITVQCARLTGQALSNPEVKVFNMQGRLVAALTPSRIKRAVRSVRVEYVWNAQGFASGAYLVSAKVQDRTWKKAVILLK